MVSSKENKRKNNSERKKGGECFFAGAAISPQRKKMFPAFLVVWLLFLSIFFNVEFAAAFTITPLRHTVVLDPGETKELPLFVINDGEQPLTVSGEVDVFTIDSETGQAIFGAADEAKNWVRPVGGELYLKPGERGALRFVGTIPKDALPGAHYLGIFAKQSAGSGTVGVGARAGALLFLNVSGNVREELVRDDFSADTNWFFFGPLDVFLQLRNEGTIHTIPEGEVQITNARGTVIATQPLNPEDEAVYPGSKWRQQYRFEKLSWTNVGPLTVRLQTQYGVTKQVMSDEVRVWYVPAVIVGPVLLAVFAFGFFAVKRFRKYEKK